MNNDKADFNKNWYELWMQQSKVFFDVSQNNLQGLFTENAYANPEEYVQQIHLWLDALRKQWEFNHLTEEQRTYQAYWSMMSKMSNDAAELMMYEWIKRVREQHPVKNIRDLYELWLSCCHEIYQKTLRTQAYQETYGDFMNAAIKFWQGTLTK